MPISAIDAISPAFQHTKQQLFQPFNLGQWVKLAFVGLLAGELTTGSCGNFNGNFQPPRHPNHFLNPAFPHVDPVIFALLIILLAVFAFLFWMFLIYVNSVMRFILFDSVIAKNCEIRERWGQRQGPGWRYFLWQIVFAIVMFVGFAILIGIPAGFAFAAGWLTKPKEHLAPLILFGIALFMVLMAFVVLLAIVHVFTKDFVIPLMAIENISAFEAWGRLLPMLGSEKVAYFAYVLMKIVMTVGVGIVLGIVTTIIIILLLIPIGGLGALLVLTGKAAGFGWNPYTITAAVVVGCIVLAAILYVVSLVAVPAMVFFPAYSIYFFASRYPALEALLRPITPAPQPLPPAPLTPGVVA
ncbi:MAG: hypothetical protein JOZ80_15780 [Acidobacteriaceae bacterium]|nr:hypothetical protein [Acidobacteriaceae bacterium]